MMDMKLSLRTFLAIVQFGVMLISLSVVYLDVSLDIYMYYMLCLYIECVGISFFGRKLNLFQLFLGTLLLFNLARVFLNCFGFYDFRFFYMLSQHMYLSDWEAAETLKTMISFLAGVSAGWALTLRKPGQDKWFNQHRPMLLGKLCKYAFYFFSLLNLIISLIYVRLVLQYGYVEIIHMHLMNDLLDAWYMKMPEYLSMAFGLLVLFYYRDEKSYLKNSFILALPMVVYMFTGQRGETMYTLLLLLWLWSTYYREVSYKMTALVGVVLIFTATAVEQLRNTLSIAGIAIVSFADTVLNFFVAQSASLGLVPGVIRYGDTFTNKVPFFVGYLVDLLNVSSWSAGNNTMEAVLERNYLGAHFAYNFSPTRYFAGNSMGTAIVAEFYELVAGNMVFIALLGMLLILVATRISRNLYKNPFTFAFGFVFLGRFIYSPRDSVGKVLLLSTVYLLIVIGFVYILERFLATAGFAKENKQS